MINEALGCAACGVPDKVHDVDKQKPHRDDGHCQQPKVHEVKHDVDISGGDSKDGCKGQNGGRSNKNVIVGDHGQDKGCGDGRKGQKDWKPRTKDGDKGCQLRGNSGQDCKRKSDDHNNKPTCNKPVAKPAWGCNA
jgi:hypothetical protein